jgi:hypothetical protein
MKHQKVQNNYPFHLNAPNPRILLSQERYSHMLLECLPLSPQPAFIQPTPVDFFKSLRHQV